MRHKSIRTAVLLSFALAFGGAFLIALLLPAWLIPFLTSALLWNLWGAYWFYQQQKQIRTLSQQLMQVYNSGLDIDIRDNEEGALSILRNDIYKIVHTFSEQKEQLAKKQQFLVDTLNDISHQLKTPLTSMQVMNELLQQDLPPQKREEFTQIMQKQLERLQWLVSSLLKLAKMDAHAISFQRKDTSLEALVLAAIEPVAALISEKGLHVHMQTKQLHIYTDFNWTKEALLNILKNAAEHTPENGNIVIEAHATPFGVSLSIQDDGEGMDREEQARVFERFYRGKQADSDSVGIGMAMAHAILHAQQADIRVDSQPRQGTCFTIRFPAKENTALSPSASAR